MIIRVNNNRQANALVSCQYWHKPFLFDGTPYFVCEVRPIGSGKTARIEAELKPVWDINEEDLF